MFGDLEIFSQFTYHLVPQKQKPNSFAVFLLRFICAKFVLRYKFLEIVKFTQNQSYLLSYEIWILDALNLHKKKRIKFHISSTPDLMKQVNVLEEYFGNFIENLAISSLVKSLSFVTILGCMV